MKMKRFCANCPCFHMKFIKDELNGKQLSLYFIYKMIGSCHQVHGFSECHSDGKTVRVIIDKEAFARCFKNMFPYSFEYKYSELPELLEPYAESYVESCNDCLLETDDKDCEFYLERTMEEWNEKNAKNLE